MRACSIAQSSFDVSGPKQIGTAANWTAIDAGKLHSVGLQSDNTLWTWGRNTEGQLGLGNTTSVNVPATVP